MVKGSVNQRWRERVWQLVWQETVGRRVVLKEGGEGGEVAGDSAT